MFKGIVVEGGLSFSCLVRQNSSVFKGAAEDFQSSAPVEFCTIPVCLKGQLKTVSSSCAVLRILDVLKGTVGGGGGGGSFFSLWSSA